MRQWKTKRNTMQPLDISTICKQIHEKKNETYAVFQKQTDSLYKAVIKRRFCVFLFFPPFLSLKFVYGVAALPWWSTLMIAGYRCRCCSSNSTQTTEKKPPLKPTFVGFGFSSKEEEKYERFLFFKIDFAIYIKRTIELKSIR